MRTLVRIPTMHALDETVGINFDYFKPHQRARLAEIHRVVWDKIDVAAEGLPQDLTATVVFSEGATRMDPYQHPFLHRRRKENTRRLKRDFLESENRQDQLVQRLVTRGAVVLPTEGIHYRLGNIYPELLDEFGNYLMERRNQKIAKRFNKWVQSDGRGIVILGAGNHDLLPYLDNDVQQVFLDEQINKTIGEVNPEVREIVKSAYEESGYNRGQER